MTRPDPRRRCLAEHASVSSGGVRCVARGGGGAARSPREVPVSGAWPLRSKFRVGGRLIAVRETDRVVVRRAGAIAGEGRHEALPAQEGAHAAPVRPGGVPRVGVGRVSPRVADGGHAAGGGAVRDPGLRREAVPAEFRLGGRPNPVRDAIRVLVQRDSGVAEEGHREALPAQEGAYAAPARVREPSPGVGVGGVPRRVSDGGRAARGWSVKGAGLRRVAARAEFRLGGRRITVRDAAGVLVRYDSGIAEEGRRGALLAQEGAYAAPVRVGEPSPGPGAGSGARRVSDGGRAARGGSVKGAGLRRAAARADFRLGGRPNPVRDAARITVQRDSGIAGEGRGEALPAQEGASAAAVCVGEPSPGCGPGAEPGASPMAVVPPVGGP